MNKDQYSLWLRYSIFIIKINLLNNILMPTDMKVEKKIARNSM